MPGTWAQQSSGSCCEIPFCPTTSGSDLFGVQIVPVTSEDYLGIRVGYWPALRFKRPPWGFGSPQGGFQCDSRPDGDRAISQTGVSGDLAETQTLLSESLNLDEFDLAAKSARGRPVAIRIGRGIVS